MKNIRKLCMLLVMAIMIGLVPVKPVEAANTFSLTGKITKYRISTDNYPKGTNLAPKLEKTGENEYKLTQYTNTTIYLGYKKGNKDLYVSCLSDHREYSIYEKDNSIVIDHDYCDTYFENHPDKKWYKKTFILQLTDYYYDFDPDTKTYGPKIKLTLVVKKLPRNNDEIRFDQAFEETGVNKATTQFQKVLAIYQWVVSNISADYTGSCSSTYEVLKNKKASYEGYSTLISSMCRRAGIESNTVRSEKHSWNIVKLGKKWYYLDVCMDRYEDVFSFAYFLRGRNLESVEGYDSLWKSDRELIKQLPISENNYVIPDSFYLKLLKKDYISEKAAYESEISKLGTMSFNDWLMYTINGTVDDLDEYALIYYQSLYEERTNTASFLEYKEFQTEAAYLEFELLRRVYHGKNFNSKYQEFLKKYPEENHEKSAGFSYRLQNASL